MQDQARSIRRARALLAVALHPNTPPAEAATARRLARVLMLRNDLVDADLGQPSAGMRYRADPSTAEDHRYNPTTPAHSTPGRKWSVYERAAYAEDEHWSGLKVSIRFGDRVAPSVADLFKNMGS